MALQRNLSARQHAVFSPWRAFRRIRLNVIDRWFAIHFDHNSFAVDDDVVLKPFVVFDGRLGNMLDVEQAAGLSFVSMSSVDLSLVTF